MTKNIVLIGFMGTGKSSCGKALATRLGSAFIDLDKYIETKEKMSIPEIFAAKGEAYFREKEREAVRAVVRRKGVVIATGGGTIKDEGNFALLKERGVSARCSTGRRTVARAWRSCWRAAKGCTSAPILPLIRAHCRRCR